MEHKHVFDSNVLYTREIVGSHSSMVAYTLGCRCGHRYARYGIENMTAYTLESLESLLGVRFHTEEQNG
jgi:hypothetical protein